MIRLAGLLTFIILAFCLINAARNTSLSSHKTQANAIIDQIR